MLVETKLRLLIAKVTMVIATVATASCAVTPVGSSELKLPRSAIHASAKHAA